MFLIETEGHAAPTGVTGRVSKEARFESRMVGRDPEYQRLCARLGRVRAGEGGAVLLSGEAGVGKTRLLTELSRGAGGPNSRVLRGRPLFEGGPPHPPRHPVPTHALHVT